MVSRLSVSDWSSFLDKEYLAGYVRDGGAAVKFAVVPDVATSRQLRDSVAEYGRARGLHVASVCASRTRVHLIQHVFFSVASGLDWVQMARRVVAECAKANWGEPVNGRTSVREIAAALQIDETTVRTVMQKELSQRIMRDYSLAKDFRIAMMQVCLPEWWPEAYTEEGRESLLQWLHGELRLISAVKDKHIFQKIGRHNARAMLASASRWAAKSARGKGGIVLVLDMAQLAVPRRALVEEGEVYYSPAATMDAYEVLRQFIDATDEMEHFMLLVLLPEELLDDASNRGIPKYQALRNRIWDDVRDRLRPNPLAPMVRIAESEVDHDG